MFLRDMFMLALKHQRENLVVILFLMEPINYIVVNLGRQVLPLCKRLKRGLKSTCSQMPQRLLSHWILYLE